MKTLFCPACGTENLEESLLCTHCGGGLSSDSNANQLIAKNSIPIVWSATGLFVLLLSVLLFLPTLLSALQKISFSVMKPEGETFFFLQRFFSSVDIEQSIVSPSGLSGLFWPLLCFFLVGILVSVLFRRRVFREIAIGSAVSAIVQLLFYLFSLSFRLDLFWGGTLYLLKEGSNILALPSGFFFLGIFCLSWMVGCFGGVFGSFLQEKISGQLTCGHCQKRFSSQKTSQILVCPHCREMLAQSRIRWPWVMFGSMAMLSFYVFLMSFLGGPFDFYYRCDPNEMTKACETAYQKSSQSLIREKASSPWVVLGKFSQKDTGAYLLLLHSWKYIAFLCLIFFLVPFFLAWKLTRGAIPTAGMAIPFGWLAITIVALVFYELGGFEGSFLLSLRLHVFAFFLWGLLGSIGAISGQKIRPASAENLLKEYGIDQSF